MKFRQIGILSFLVLILIASQMTAEPPNFYRLDNSNDNKIPFSLKFWGGFFDTSGSRAATSDSLTLIKGTNKEFADNFFAGGISVTDVPFAPSAKKGIAKWFFAGIDAFTLYGTYTVDALSSDGLSSQKSELLSKTLGLTGHIKIAPLSGSFVNPYIGFGGGPSYTQLRDTRTTILSDGTMRVERDRKWDTSNIGAAFGGIDVYLGKSFHLNLELRWIGLTNVHLNFPDSTTEHHTAKVKTTLEGWVQTFGLGLKF
jgi:hypothetical protein